jgi:hypothetical protein
MEQCIRSADSFKYAQHKEPEHTLICTLLVCGARRDRIELPGNVIRVIEADVLMVGRGIFFNPIVAYACRV